MESVFSVSQWKGNYEQGGRATQMDFERMSFNKDGDIEGYGTDPVGRFEIMGRVLKTPHTDFQFTKKYFGQHTVLYAGRFVFEEGVIVKLEGNWEIYHPEFNMSDRFSLYPDLG